MRQQARQKWEQSKRERQPEKHMETVKTLETLREILGEPGQLTRFKIHQALNARSQDFIRHSPLLMLSTSSRSGESTVSPKGDEPGFVSVRDEVTLYIPERQGNKLIFSLQNILENPNVGLLFMVPGTNETLRVRGTAELTADAALCQELSSRGKAALLVIVVKVTECYFHCAKAFLRGQVWRPESWPEPIRVSFGEEIACNLEMSEQAVRELDSAVQERYQTDL
ncbi:MAG TPA: MSMEG_1061 family FMN-dependent PPOX-type flavoprotein [Blastocatellia bacterium]|nr:MSMEG_1061 family FMN-dependent PPOX-type flavoprotein [Blastocatellia bacterium]